MKKVGTCPKCGSDNISYESPDFCSDDTIFQTGVCEDCGCEFNEIYEFKHQEIIKKDC